MAGSGRSNADALLAVAIAGGKTIPEAAEAAGVSERTVSRRLLDAAFQLQVNELRAGMVQATAGIIARAQTLAAGTLEALLASQDEKVRLAAAKALLDSGLRFRDAADLERRLNALERGEASSGADDDLDHDEGEA